MTEQHPITPPPELVHQWYNRCHKSHEPFFIHIANCAAQWGWDQREPKIQAAADAEFEACCEWFQEFYKTESWVTRDLKHFRAARRPKPLSLKEQALSELNLTADSDGAELSSSQVELIRKALEQLND